MPEQAPQHDAADLPASAELLKRNLAALAKTSRATAEAVQRATSRADLAWHQAADEVLVASVEGRALASKRRPREEARRFAAELDPAEVGAAVVTGFGCGHHVQAVCEKMGRGGVVLCFEPDVGLLRAVLERIDCTRWIEAGNIAVLTDPDDSSAISASLKGVESVVALGIKVLHHQPSQPRLGAQSQRFCESLAGVVQALKTTLVTTLMQTETTLRNLLGNADWYASCPGAGELEGCAAGRPAVVVSAGPSLARNLDVLGRPGVRDRVVIIAVQTALKPMLKAGIRPHFVVAVDYHQISKRFYEGLTAQDVRSVTLVCDPKANPTICETWPGAIRLMHDPVLQGVLQGGDARSLEPACAHDTAAVPPSATVAHLAYSVARLMACDPVLLIGQDLGFSDGLYYGPGAAIHDVWASELGELCTLETLEWERIARGRPHSRKLEDVHGKDIYTDEQMHTYLVQFEKMFADDALRGWTTIDASEGGVAKRHTRAMKLVEALEQFAGGDQPVLSLPAAERDGEARRAAAVRVASRLRGVRDQVREIGAISRSTADLLDNMTRCAGRPHAVNPLVEQAHENGKKAAALEPAYSLTQYLNQTGALKRFKADRDLHYAGDLSESDRQIRQIERDKMNVSWLADAADQLEAMLDEAISAMQTQQKLTADPRDVAGAIEVNEPQRLAAVLLVDADTDGLGLGRRIDQPLAGGATPLERTLRQIAASTSIRRAIIVAQDVERIRAALGACIDGGMDGLEIVLEQSEDHPLGEKRSMVAASRRHASASWRGGAGGATVYDEVFSAPVVQRVMQDHDLTAAVMIGPDWSLIDPGLIDACVDRLAEHPGRNRLVFTQAAPGLGPMVLARSLVDELAKSEGAHRLWSSIAGLVNYTPVAPQPDPIAKSYCVRVEPELRDAGVRCIVDGSWHGRLMARAIAKLGRGGAISASSLTDWLASTAWARSAPPMDVILELCTGRLVGGRGTMHGPHRMDPPERHPVDVDRARTWLRELGAMSPGASVTLAGAGDPLLHGRWIDVAHAARDAGLGVHVRTDLLTEGAVQRVLEAQPDVVSVDLYADDAQTYRAVAGADHFDRVQASMRALIESRDASLASMWIVPRITRHDAVLDQIEAFYDRWLLAAGACVIDGPRKGSPGQRVQRLPRPELARLRRTAWRLRVRCDGIATRPGNASTVDLSRCSVHEAWEQLSRRRRPERAVA